MREIIVQLAIVVCAVCGGCSWDNHPGAPAAQNTAATQKEINNSLLSYLSPSSTLDTAELSQQILGDATLALWDNSEKGQKLYFQTPETARSKLLEPNGRKELFGRFLVDPDKVQFRADESKTEFGAIRIRVNEGVWFMTSYANFNVPGDTSFRFPFRDADYVVTAKETSEFLRNDVIWGGLLTPISREDSSGRKTVFVNHGAFVAKPGEPSLTRLVKQLTEKLPDDREVRLQTVLTFVCNQIDYDHEIAKRSLQIVHRPNEVLMARRTICGSKAILFCSMLAQMKEEHHLLYFLGDQHVSVVVKQGRFPNTNGHALKYRDEEWVLAEPTCPNFVAGVTRLKNMALDRLDFIQTPSELDVIINAKTGEKTRFD